MTVQQLQLEQNEAYYVYLLARPDGSVFYVGKGKKNRIDHHEYQARKGCRCDKCQVIQNIWNEGGQVARSIVYRTGDSYDALRYEAELIHKYRNQLVNKKHGRRRVHIMAPIVDISPDRLRVPGKRRKRVTKEQLRRDRMLRAATMINSLDREIGLAIRYKREYLIERLEAEIAAYRFWIHPPVQLKLFD